jgi:hypothetical protein
MVVTEVVEYLLLVAVLLVQVEQAVGVMALQVTALLVLITLMAQEEPIMVPKIMDRLDILDSDTTPQAHSHKGTT